MASASVAPAASLLRLHSSPSPSITTTTNRPLSVPLSTPRSLSYLSLSTTHHCLPRPLPKASQGEGGAVAVAVAVKEKEEEEEAENQKEKRRLYIGNLPFGLSASHLEALFSQCCPLGRIDMKVIKNQKGEKNGWAFVTVDSDDDARAIIDKFNSYVLLDKTIKVEYPKSANKPTPPPPPPIHKELWHVVYISNLAWKARKGNLEEFFSAFKPISARVIFDSLSKKATGYGFVNFATKEEALAAIAELNGKELMGRPLKLKLNERNVDKPAIVQEPAETGGEPAVVS